MLKVDPAPDYPPEEGRYLRGNHYSPVAVAIILNADADKIPPEIEILVRAGIESGAALSGTVQTPNIGLEKIVCNIIANPNIRYLVLGGPESPGHSTGDALKALFRNGVDAKKKIIGTESPDASLFNLTDKMIERFRQQVSLVDIQFEGDPDWVRKAVWSCYQEEPVSFREYSLYDPGAYPEPAICGQLTWRITQPWLEQDLGDKERDAKEKALKMMEQLKARSKAKELPK